MSETVLVSDIHANALALEAVIEREGDKTYHVLGDIHGLLGYPAETHEMVFELPGVVLGGNHDKAIFEYGEGHVNSTELSRFERDYTLSALNPAACSVMKSLPYLEVVHDGFNRICLTHAYPWPEKASGYEPGNAGVRKKDVPEIASVVADDYEYVFHGHTHTQYDLDCERFGHDVHFVNPGSLGYGGEYSVVDTTDGTVKHRSVDPQLVKVREHLDQILPDGCPSVFRWL